MNLQHVVLAKIGEKIRGCAIKNLKLEDISDIVARYKIAEELGALLMEADDIDEDFAFECLSYLFEEVKAEEEGAEDPLCLGSNLVARITHMARMQQIRTSTAQPAAAG